MSSAQMLAIASDLSSPSAHANRAEVLLQVAEALAALTEHQRQVFLLRHCESLSMQAISARLGKTRPAVAGLLRRATVALQDSLTSKTD